MIQQCIKHFHCSTNPYVLKFWLLLPAGTSVGMTAWFKGSVLLRDTLAVFCHIFVRDICIHHITEDIVGVDTKAGGLGTPENRVHSPPHTHTPYYFYTNILYEPFHSRKTAFENSSPPV